MKISKTTIISDAVKQDPQIAQLLFESGIHCLGCQMAAMETIEQGLSAHGLSEKEIDSIVQKMNNIIQEKSDFDKSGKILFLTKIAKQELLKLIKMQKKVKYIRIIASKDKDGEIEYEFDFDAKKEDNDKLIEEAEIKFLLDKKSLPLIKGTRIDFKEGFMIDNPNEDR